MVLIFQVSVLCNLFKESRSDRQSKEVLGEITDYNRRYSGAPRRVSTLSKFQHTHSLTLNERGLLLKTILQVFPKMFSLFSPFAPLSGLTAGVRFPCYFNVTPDSIMRKMIIPPLFSLIMC